MILSLIAAMGENRVIGEGGRVPWHLPEDLAFFKRTTWGHPVLLGRKTWETVNVPLPGRRTIVLSRRKTFDAPGAEVLPDLTSALALFADSDEELFVCGGGEVYAQALPLASRIYLTVVHAAFPGDAFFPEVPAELFRETSRADRPGPPPFTFLRYERR
ncbi:MAG: dihydrofolate reductase [Acidobacteriota bacterium]